VVEGAVKLAAPLIAAAVVDRLVERLPDIVDTITERVVAGITDIPNSALGALPNLAETVAKEILRNLPFGLGSSS